MRNRRFYLGFLVVALLIAGIVSGFASANPDGLEHVAETLGFSGTATDHATGDGPFADYGIKGIGNARLSGGLAGVLGALVCLLIAGGLAWMLRRRTSPEE
ncbi:PDGLE domain-containing protein [Nocardioides daejeonensis]|uniref:PDGLE domain-containing protein n=1 Tax=Nocardioides daejeonensis TaxID=1046556 RepID=UPI0019504601|nr:PDGLE domain-containing protein [Nocardioides daejeonensis]